ncbi:hypothetical protein ACLOJK_022082 [Asimina triloba]
MAGSSHWWIMMDSSMVMTGGGDLAWPRFESATGELISDGRLLFIIDVLDDVAARNSCLEADVLVLDAGGCHGWATPCLPWIWGGRSCPVLIGVARFAICCPLICRVLLGFGSHQSPSICHGDDNGLLCLPSGSAIEWVLHELLDGIIGWSCSPT